MFMLSNHAPDDNVVNKVREAGKVFVLQKTGEQMAQAGEPHEEHVAAIFMEPVVASQHVAISMDSTSHAAERFEAQATLFVTLGALVTARSARWPPHSGAAVIVFHVVQEEFLSLLADTAPRAQVPSEARNGVGAAGLNHRRTPLVLAVLLHFRLTLGRPVVDALS